MGFGIKNLRFKQFLMSFICLAVFVTVAARRDGRIFGYELNGSDDIIRYSGDTVVVNTSSLGSDVIGYAGPVPLEIYILRNKVVKIKALPNNETPGFFIRASNILRNLEGLTVEEALKTDVDAVSGTTFSSEAVIYNVQLGLGYVSKLSAAGVKKKDFDFSLKFLLSFLVVLMGAIIPLVYKNRNYRLVQLALNVVILGFWCGTFLSHSQILSYVSNGMDLRTSIVSVIMLAVAFIYPFFGKKSHYCTYICPLGSLQELVGHISRKKIRINNKIIKFLSKAKTILWEGLMLLMLFGVWAEWMNYELFSAFLLESASFTVLILAVLFILLSVFVPRPYCRFVCPTGSLFSFVQNTN